MRRGLAHPLHQAGSGACIDWAGHRGAGDRHVMLLHPTASTVRGAKYLNETGFIRTSRAKRQLPFTLNDLPDKSSCKREAISRVKRRRMPGLDR